MNVVQRLALACGLAAVAAAGALALARSADGAARPSLVIRLISVTTSANFDDKAPRGPSAGDRFITTSRLVNAVAQLGRPRGAVVGSDAGSITLSSPSAGRLDVRVRLPGGTLRLQGRVRLSGGAREVYPVSGGTGRFAGARGTLTVSPLPGANRASNVYRLTLAI